MHPGHRSHDAVGEILKAIVQLGSDGTHGAVHHLLHQHLQLLLRQVHVETLLQVTDGAGAVEAGKLRTCTTYKKRNDKVSSDEYRKTKMLHPLKLQTNNTLMHDFYNLDDLLHVLACSDEALEHKHPIIIEHVSIQTSHYLKEMHSF